MNSIAAIILASGLHGYFCANDGVKVGEFHLYDRGQEVIRLLVMPDGRTFADLVEPLHPLKSPTVKADAGVKCYALVPLK